MSKTSYAKAAELAANKRAKYEKKLEDAMRTGDRFSINTAKLALDKLDQFENTLFASQEDKKASKGIKSPQQQIPMAAMGGPLYPTSPNAYDQAVVNTARQMLVNDGVSAFKSTQNFTPQQILDAASQKGLLDLAKQNAREILAKGSEQKTTVYGMGGSYKPKYNDGGPVDGANVPLSQTPLGKGLDVASKFLPYAAQFAPDIYAVRQLKNIQAPAALPMMDAPMLNTDVDTSATQAAVEANRLATNAAIDADLSNSATATSAKLAAMLGSNRQIADVLQGEANQEMALRNQQIAAGTEALNANRSIAAQNEQNLIDYNNMITNARLGIYQGMGTKAAQIKSEYNQMALDQAKLDTLAKQFDQDLLARNFTNFGQYKDLIYNNPDAARKMHESLKLNATQAQVIKDSDPQLYEYLTTNYGEL